ncbi:MAG: O-antigen ligase family protein, partial [Chloroflexota bacterium]
ALALPMALLLVTLLLASIFAPSDNAHAFKVTARWFAGMMVCWMTIAAVCSGLNQQWLMRAVVCGGALVALLTVAEYGWSDQALVGSALAAFRDTPDFRVGGELRPSATLAYPTITALYLEFAFVFAVGWLVQTTTQRRRWPTVALAVTLLLIGTALVLTLTRSALVAVASAFLLVVAVRWPRARADGFARVAVLAVGVLGASVLVAALLNPLLSLRLSSANDRDWYVAAYTAPPLPPLRAGETITVAVTVRNIGQRLWEARGPHPTYLNHHWLSADGQTLIAADRNHTPIAHDVAPGESIVVPTQVFVLDTPGDYILAWDLLRADLFWFSVLGAPMGETRVTVLPGVAAAPASPPANSPAPNVLADLNADRATLWRAALLMLAAHPLLGVGPGNYRLVLGQYLNLPQWDTRLHANNMYLELFADAGLLGGVAFLLLVIAIVRAGWRTVRVAARDEGIAGATLAAALAAFLLHGVTDYFLEFTPIYVLFWLTVGLILAGETRFAQV